MNIILAPTLHLHNMLYLHAWSTLFYYTLFSYKSPVFLLLYELPVPPLRLVLVHRNGPLGIDDQEASKASRMACLFHVSSLVLPPNIFVSGRPFESCLAQDTPSESLTGRVRGWLMLCRRHTAPVSCHPFPR